MHHRHWLCDSNLIKTQHAVLHSGLTWLNWTLAVLESMFGQVLSYQSKKL